MTTTLTRLPGSKWWVETDDTTGDIVGTYNKTAITADIQAIRDTLTRYPDPDLEASDYAELLSKLSSVFNATKTERVTAMEGRMWGAYGGSAQAVEVAQLIAKLDYLTALRDRLV